MYFRRRTKSGIEVIVFVAITCSLLTAPRSHAANPPLPEFSTLFGHALVAGTNISPEEQRVIAFVRGGACGEGRTLAPAAGEGVPPTDVGRTVYTVNVLPSGPGAGQRPGCAFPGDQVTLYFPESHRTTTLPLAYSAGGRRVDLDLDIDMQFRVGLPQVAGDGAP
jgi:hypothetical protein